MAHPLLRSNDWTKRSWHLAVRDAASPGTGKSMEIIPLVKGSEASNHVENPQRHQGGHIGLTWVNDGKRCTTTYIILYLTMKCGLLHIEVRIDFALAASSGLRSHRTRWSPRKVSTATTWAQLHVMIFQSLAARVEDLPKFGAEVLRPCSRICSLAKMAEPPWWLTRFTWMRMIPIYLNLLFVLTLETVFAMLLWICCNIYVTVTPDLEQPNRPQRIPAPTRKWLVVGQPPTSWHATHATQQGSPQVPRDKLEHNGLLPLRSAHHVYIFGRPLQSHKES